MNEMNDLEMLLNSWAPRRPSPKVSRRLFAGEHPGLVAPKSDEGGSVIAHDAPGPRFLWLAPAAACLLLALAIVGQRNGSSFPHPTNSMPIMAVILSNQSYAAYLPSSFQPEQNSLRNTFEWTNLSPSATSKGLLSPMKEND